MFSKKFALARILGLFSISIIQGPGSTNRLA